MRAWAIARRELRAAFELPIASVFIASFLALAALGGLAGFFERNVSDLRDYFAGLRYVFVLFAPAVSMRLWAEERRSGTFELLFTLPVKPWEAVLGKFLGALGLVLGTLALGTLLPLTLARWASFDAGAVLAGYLGVALLAALEVALGLLVSALTENQIVAFVGAAGASLALLVLGEPVLLVEAERAGGPGLSRFLARIGTGEHQEALARGVLDSRDVVYFVGLTLACLLANVVAVERRRGRLEPLLACALAFVAALVAEDVAGRRRVRVDLTSRRAFSLSPALEDALGQVEARLTVRCYLSRDLPPSEARRQRVLLDLLDEVAARGGKNVALEILDPRGDERLTEQAEAEGITRITRRAEGEGRSESRVIWCGVSLLYGGKPPLAIPFALFRPNLEYDLALLVRKLVRKSPVRIAVLDRGAPGVEGYATAKAELGRAYALDELSLERDVPEDVTTVLVVADGRSAAAIDAAAVAKLEAHLRRGRSVVCLLEPVLADMRTLRATAVDWGALGQLLARRGAGVAPRLVVAESPRTYDFATAKGPAQVPYPFFLRPSGRSNRDSPIAAQLPDSFFPFAGEVTLDPKGVPLVALERAWLVPLPANLDPLAPIEVDANAAARRVVAGGVLQSEGGRLVVFADSDFARDGNIEGVRGNLDLVLSAVDWASQDAALAAVRARSGSPPLAFAEGRETREGAAALAWGLHLVGLPLLVGLAGVARFVLRRRGARRAALASRGAP